MSRIPEAEIERIKLEVAVERLAAGAGVVLGRQGDDLIGACPFCEAADAMSISPGPNLWRCRACGVGGSVIDWVMRAEGVAFRHAVELLRDGHTPTRLDGRPPARSSVAKLAAPFAPELSDGDLLERVVGFYHQALLESPDARTYLAERCVADGDAVERFGLGFSNRTLGYRVPHSQRSEGKALRTRMIDLGVYRASGHEHYSGSLVVPVRDDHGQVVQLYGRKIGKALRKGTPLHMWLPGDHRRPIWNAEAMSASDEVIVCEGIVDALTLWCAGFRNAIAPGHPAGFGTDLAVVLAEHRVRRVLIGFDADGDGDTAADALAVELLAAGIECYRLHLARGSDVNGLARRSKSPTDALGRVIRAAVWMGTGTPPRHRSMSTDPAGAEVTEPAVVSVVPPGPDPDVVPHVDGDELIVVLGDRRWRVRGLRRNTSFDALRVNVLVSIVGAERFHVDTLDLYAARARAAFIKATGDELSLQDDVVKRDLGRVLFAVEREVESLIADAQTPKHVVVELDDDERAAALELLGDPKLIDRLVSDFARAGVVGEATNCLVGYLAATSRLLDRPLAVIVQSTSAAGKSQLMDAVLSFMPAEGLVRFSAMTGQSLYYLGERDLAHKVLAVAEEEGAERASYALKLLQSEGEISIASTGKDTASGRLVTHEYRVTGPTAIFLTTTAIDVDEELLNRCLVLSVDEDRAQTRAIHVRQRRAHTLDGIIENRRRDEVLDVWRNAQRLLEPVVVVNPFADRLGFTDGRTRTRRDHVKYLTLIQAITLLHQHQRPRKTATVEGHTVTYIEATIDDIALANRLAHEVLGRSLDELPPQTRRLVDALDGMVTGIGEHRDVKRENVRFTRREVREHTGWSDFQLRTHLGRLVELEFVAVHRGGRGQSFVYELVWDGHGGGAPHLPGLVDVDNLGDPHAYDSNCEGSGGQFEGGSSPHRAGVVPPSSTPENGRSPASSRHNGTDRPKTTTGPNGKRPVEVIAAPEPITTNGADGDTGDRDVDGGPVEGVA